MCVEKRTSTVLTDYVILNEEFFQPPQTHFPSEEGRHASLELHNYCNLSSTLHNFVFLSCSTQKDVMTQTCFTPCTVIEGVHVYEIHITAFRASVVLAMHSVRWVLWKELGLWLLESWLP